jgi:oxalate decarboxylase/phosphoglucose isomerase-like protein (cupin superfamily)
MEATMESVQFFDLSGEILEDPRGFSFYPLKGRVQKPEELPEAFHLVAIAPGQVRGHHLHPHRWEWLYPFHGRGNFIWEPRPGHRRERLVSGPALIIRIPPGVAHALSNPGPEPLYLLAWREGGAGPGEDTVPYVLD